MTTSQFIKAINDQRSVTRGTWYQVSGTVHGNRFEIKAYKNWVQICRIYNPTTGQPINFSGPMDCKVSDFVKHLEKAAAYSETLKQP